MKNVALALLVLGLTACTGEVVADDNDGRAPTPVAAAVLETLDNPAYETADETADKVNDNPAYEVAGQVSPANSEVISNPLY